jgi:beta-phosphoglucomutase
VVDGFGFEHAKPAPDIFLNAARLLDAEPAACVVVEDAQSGVEAAKTAGMFAVGVARDEPLHGADLIVRAPAEIPLSLWGIEEPR